MRIFTNEYSCLKQLASHSCFRQIRSNRVRLPNANFHYWIFLFHVHSALSISLVPPIDCSTVRFLSMTCSITYLWNKASLRCVSSMVLRLATMYHATSIEFVWWVYFQARTNWIISSGGRYLLIQTMRKLSSGHSTVFLTDTQCLRLLFLVLPCKLLSRLSLLLPRNLLPRPNCACQ